MGKGQKKSKDRSFYVEGSYSVSRPFFFVVILVSSIILGWLVFSKNSPAIAGIYGVATEVSPAHSAILLESARVSNGLDFYNNGFDRFTVHWNEDTNFYITQRVLSATVDNLQAGQKIMIVPRERAGNVLTAAEVRILPD